MYRLKALGIVLAMFVLWACPSLAVKKEITHGYYASYGAEVEAWLKQKAVEFEKRTGYAVQVIPMPSAAATYIERLKVLAAGGTFPDVVDLSPANALEFLNARLLLDLRPFLRTDPDISMEDFYEVGWVGYSAPAEYGSVVYGVPNSIFTVVIGYNIDLLSNAGLAEPPRSNAWNWDMLVQYGQKLIKDTNNDGIMDVWGAEISRSINRWGPVLHHAGGSYFERAWDPDKPTLSDANSKVGLQFLANLSERQIAPLNSARQGGSFAGGKAGFTYSMDGTYPAAHRAGNRSFAWDYIQYPMGPKGNGSELIPSGHNIGAASKYPDVAWSWIKYLVVENAEDWVRMTGRPSALKRLLPRYPRLVEGAAPHQNALLESLMNPTSYIRPIVRDTRASTVLQNWVLKAFDKTISLDEAILQGEREAIQILQEAKR